MKLSGFYLHPYRGLREFAPSSWYILLPLKLCWASTINCATTFSHLLQTSFSREQNKIYSFCHSTAEQQSAVSISTEKLSLTASLPLPVNLMKPPVSSRWTADTDTEWRRGSTCWRNTYFLASNSYKQLFCNIGNKKCLDI